MKKDIVINTLIDNYEKISFRVKRSPYPLGTRSYLATEEVIITDSDVGCPSPEGELEMREGSSSY